MKRTFTQKVKADSFEAPSKPEKEKHIASAAITTEVNRRARTSAAMIGLAISMGASGLLLPQQGDEALAVEPIAAEPTLTNLPVDPESSVSASSEEEPDLTASTSSNAAEAEPTADSPVTLPSVIEHQVEEGQTLWELSQTYEVQPEAIAVSNHIKPTGDLSVGQTLKIPAVNGIVHEVKTGETVETVSQSYGVKPTQLQALASVPESGELQAGESVTVPGKVDTLLKARQDVALDRLKEKRNRLNESLAELGSEESTNPSERASADTLPPPVFKSEQRVANTSEPIIIPVPTPEVAVSPAVEAGSTRPSPLPVIIPVPTPEVAASPTVKSEGIQQFQPPVVIPVPTPESAASPTRESKTGNPTPSSVVIPVPTPDTAASLAVESSSKPQSPSSVVIPVPSSDTADSSSGQPKPIVIPSLPTEPVTAPETLAKPPVPQPVVIQPLVASKPADLYQVKPGDTLDAIARRYGLSRSELIQVNGLNNPNLIRVNQQLKIPSTPPAGTTPRSVTLLPGITSNSDPLASRQEQQQIGAPTLVVPAVPTPVRPIAPTQPYSQPQTVLSPVLAQSPVEKDTQANSTVVVNARSNLSTNSDPYVERLRADILRLREEYRYQGTIPQSTVASSVVVPTVSAAPRVENQVTSSRTNPEFNPTRYQQQTQQASIPIDVPAPATTSSPTQQQLLAVAPAPAESYNPALQIPVGQTVSPEVPPLSAPDMYLPDSPARFNGYIWPTKGVLTSGYGRRWGRMHKGIDIAAPIGTPVVAAATGVVVTAGWNSGGYGNLVEIQHPDGSLTLYAHNNRILVRRGQEVAQGQQISEMGSTGYSTGPHLHFEVHPSGRGAVNPMAYLPKER